VLDTLRCVTGGFDHDDDPLDRAGIPSPDDRLWRHPSEVAAARSRATAPTPRARHPWIVGGLGGAIGAGLTAGALSLSGAFTPDVVESTVIREEAVPVSMSMPDQPAKAVAEQTAASLARIEAVVGESLITGSAIVHDQDGHLLTNAHVVEGATSVIVVLGGELRQAAEVIGIDTTTDLAVLHIPDGANLTPVTMRTDAPADVGEQAIALGSPLGLAGAPTVSTGIVSGHRSRIETTDGRVLYGLIQTDAAIAAGSSGGALFDVEGRLLGITTAVVTSDGTTGGLSFAIPADQVVRAVDQLITTGRVIHAWMGVEGDAGATQPARLIDVVETGPAAESGLSENDIITTIDGQPTSSMADVILAVRTRYPGDVIEIEYVRAGKLRSCRVELDERPI
jgi:S1-C subfamily serine protease